MQEPRLVEYAGGILNNHRSILFPGTLTEEENLTFRTILSDHSNHTLANMLIVRFEDSFSLRNDPAEFHRLTGDTKFFLNYGAGFQYRQCQRVSIEDQHFHLESFVHFPLYPGLPEYQKENMGLLQLNAGTVFAKLSSGMELGNRLMAVCPTLFRQISASCGVEHGDPEQYFPLAIEVEVFFDESTLQLDRSRLSLHTINNSQFVNEADLSSEQDLHLTLDTVKRKIPEFWSA
jgi:hypothetical protein